MASIRLLAHRVATRLLGSETVNSTVRAIARLRGHALVLVYHRVGPGLPPGCDVIPSVPVEVFRTQVEALRQLVDLVALDDIVGRTTLPGSRPAVALTFDDDLPSHVQYALPVLRELGVPAAFFLSGRALHGLGPYWFQWLEALLVARGREKTAALLNLSGATPEQLLLAGVGNPDIRRRVCEAAAGLPAPELLDRQGIAALATTGVTIGFHTIDHLRLPGLDDSTLQDAASRGRDDLSSATGRPVQFFAYPYGKVDLRSAAAVREAGFVAAFTGRPAPSRHDDDRYQLGRWEPGPLSVDALVVKLAVRLHRASPVSPEASS